jgi:hypothetical protein
LALADYFDRAALAASQVIAGFDQATFSSVVSRSQVGLSIGADAVESTEGRYVADLVVRLVSRLFPSVQIRVDDSTFADELTALATAINPNIEFVDASTIGISIGAPMQNFDRTIYAGSRGWDAVVSTTKPVGIGSTASPFGAGAAACFAVAELFKAVFGLPTSTLDRVEFSTFNRTLGPTSPGVATAPYDLEGPVVLVGLGAIGNGAVWALGKATSSGQLHVVDPEVIELSNLQRYVMCDRSDEHRSKVDVVAAHLVGSLTAIPHEMTWARFVHDHGYEWPRVLVALDSARDRRAVQGSLPGWIANAWTQPGDLGLSVHGGFPGRGACLNCLYLPAGDVPNEDELVAAALGVPGLVADIRTLLHKGDGVPVHIAHAVAAALGLSPDAVASFVGRPVRDLYVEGVCGGALIPLGQAGLPRQELHVPLAHQSALAGILLAGALFRHRILGVEEPTTVTRIDVIGALGEYLTQPALKSNDRCICADSDFLEVYEAKYASAR